MSSLRILQISAECAPFAKTGGLADVSAALSRYLAAAGHDVRLVVPLHQRVKARAQLRPVAGLQDLKVRLGGRDQWFSIWESDAPRSKAPVWFVRAPQYFERESLYTDDADEAQRFALLTHAAFLSCQHTSWAPHVVHAHDWHAALAPLLLRTHYAWDRLFKDARSLLSIHNLGYQGWFPAAAVDELGLADERHLLHQDHLQEGRLGFLVTGLLWADMLSTVSATYAKEIQTDEHGVGLQGILRSRADRLKGIVNGIDSDEWDPSSDPRIPHHYALGELEGKRRMKAALLERVGLPPTTTAPVFGIVSRLTVQKGFELVHDAISVPLRREDMRLVVLGSGEERYERFFGWLAQTFPGKVAYLQSYDEELSHWIEAGSDAFLMPSRYEPCGLNQMYSQRYGTVPLVRRTGGLADTVQDWDPAARTGTGFVFDRFDAQSFHQALERVFATWRDQDSWRRLQAQGMALDWSWEKRIGEYVELYRSLHALRR